MKDQLFRAILAASAVAGHSMAVEPLSSYTNVVTHAIEVSESSAVTYNWDTDTLFAIGDEGEALYQLTKEGQIIDQMGFDYYVSPRQDRALDDPEGVAYLGNNTFVFADERDFHARITTYQAGGLRTQADITPTSYDLDYLNAWGDLNAGLEGIAFDPVDKAIWGVKESGPLSVYKMTGVPQIPGNTGPSVAVGEPIERRFITRWDNAPWNVEQSSEIYALAASGAFPVGHPRRMNLLILARTVHLILEVSRTGAVVDVLDIGGIGRGTIEGMTMDNDGILYLVSEQTAAPNNFPALHVLSTPSPKPFSVTGCVLEESEESVTASITWNATIGKQYVVEFSDTLANDDWQAVSPSSTATAASSTVVTQPLPRSEKGFFRVKEVAP